MPNVEPSHRRDRARPAQPQGFTLIELLVVISIIALLISILIPALGSAKEKARTILCMSNMRQLAVATNGYANDHRGFYPQPGNDADLEDVKGPTVSASAIWFNAVDTYLNQSKKNYSASSTTERNYIEFKQDPVWKGFDDVVKTQARTIKMNDFFGDIYDDLANNPSDWRFFRTDEVKYPDSTVLFFDGRSHDTPSATTGNIDISGSRNFGAAEVFVGLRHTGGANVLTVDGHAEYANQAVRQSATGYLGWFVAPITTVGDGAGPQKFRWFRQGRGGVFDN